MSSSTLADAVARRRTFAIISHPDAGKTTLTEKLLLYGGAIHLAGSVKARRAARHATSDWMKLEQERGISITSSVLQFEYDGHKVNLLDTPGHQDFSEDTYRTLVAADSAVMLLDNRKGVEEQTRKLFAVCHRGARRSSCSSTSATVPASRRSSCSMMWRRSWGCAVIPVTWPITEGGRLVGVYDRLTRQIHLFERDAHHGSKQAHARLAARHGRGTQAARRRGARGAARRHRAARRGRRRLRRRKRSSRHARARVLRQCAHELRRRAVPAHFLRNGTAAGPRPSSEGMVDPLDDSFTGFVFKIQANMDPKHRDRIAFLRICSGRFEPGLVGAEHAQRRQRAAGAAAAVHGAGADAHRRGVAGRRGGPARPGQAAHRRHAVAERARSTSRRCRASRRSTSRASWYAIHCVASTWTRVCASSRRRARRRSSTQRRMRDRSRSSARSVDFSSTCCCTGWRHEYGVEARLENLPYGHARWVTGPRTEIDRLGGSTGRSLVFDSKNRPLLLFESEWTMRHTIDKHPDLQFHDVAV
jgi:peptide chain release factor 3